MACRNSFNQVVSTFPIDLLNVTPDDCIVGGQPFNAAIDPTIALDTAFLQAAAETLCALGTLLTEADVSIAQVAVDAIAGATCTAQLSELPPPLPLTVTIDVTRLAGCSCGADGLYRRSVNSRESRSRFRRSYVPCTAGTVGSEVQICSTGTTPLGIPSTTLGPNITLADPADDTWVGVNVPAGGSPPPFRSSSRATHRPP